MCRLRRTRCGRWAWSRLQTARTVYVTTGRGGTLEAIDSATNAIRGSARVGERPWGLAVSADGKTIYTANGPSNDVSFVDAATLTVAATVKVGDRPWGLALVPGTGGDFGK